MKTAKQLVEEIRASKSDYVMYGGSDVVVKKEEAIRDIKSMDDDMIGDGDWCECDENGKIG